MTNFEYEIPLPGQFIEEELEARSWSQRDLAFILGIEEPALNRIIRGRTGISFEMSKKLGKAFDIDADFFANLQKDYDFAHSKEPDPGVEQRAALQKAYPVREMIQRGWISKDNIEIQLERFLRVANSSGVPTAHAAKRSDDSEDKANLQLAWLSRVMQIAASVPVKTYSEKALREALPRLHSLMIEPEEARHVPRILMECGVKFVVVEGLSGAKIDGVCVWQEGRPIIGMSVRFDRIDNFWFVLRHEIEHVLRKHGQNGAIIDVEVMETSEDELTSEQEKVANHAAAEFCVSRSEMDSFIARKAPYFYERDTVGFARRIGVHPGIVVGQLQSRTKKWDYLRKYLVKIRQFILPGAMVDGWGQIAPVSL